MAKDGFKQSRTIAGFLLVTAAAVLPANTARADTLFSDNFMSSTLNSAWQVLPGDGSYSVGGGQLQMNYAGPVSSTTGWYNPALTLGLSFTGTNWEIDTKAAYNLEWCPPGSSYTGPAVPDPGCTSGAQGPQIAVAFTPGTTTSGNGGPDYAGSDYALIERNIDAYYGSNQLTASYGGVSTGNLLNPADANINNNVAGGTYWYQIIRSGGTLSINYSYDGSNFLNAFTTTLANPSGTNNELLLGGITYSSAGSFADYSYVNITTPNTMPEPGNFALLAFGLLGLAVAAGRRTRLARLSAASE